MIMKNADKVLFAVGCLYLAAGMAVGISMGITHDFTLRHFHAHLNLVGFAVHTTTGLAYRAWPELKQDQIALGHVWLTLIGTPTFLAGTVLITQNGPRWPIVAGSLAVASGAVVFAGICLLRLARSNADASHPRAITPDRG